MANENIETPERADAADEPRSAGVGKGKGRRGRKWGLIALLSLVVTPATLFALWAWITLSYTYSTGDRAGYLQKLSKKGWICKTWEGELAMASMPGAMPEIFHFTVRNDELAGRMQRMSGQRVSITYEEHKGVPTSCFGDTKYFVTEARTIADPLMPGQTPGGPPAQPVPGTPPPAQPPTTPPAPPPRTP
jgi:hypothetical protein